MHPDFILLNARIATMDATGTEAGALAALNGRIVAIGDDAAIRDLAGPGTTILNARFTHHSVEHYIEQLAALRELVPVK